MHKKQIKITLGSTVAVILVIIGWIIFKPYDYTVSFKTKANHGTINQTLKMWSGSLKNTKIIENHSIDNIKQQIKKGDKLYTYNWKFTSINDSLNKVNIGIIDTKTNSIKRIFNLVKKTQTGEIAEVQVKSFIKVLKDHLKSHDVEIIGETDSPEVYCVYIPLESKQMLKSNNMMKNYNYVSNMLLKNNIELKGDPMIEITEWNKKTDSISYNFCFPIEKHDSIPDLSPLKYKRIKSKKSLNAVYRGNYITSDRAWYALSDYAEKNNINIAKQALEVFHDNPMKGSNDKNWKADIYMPIINK